VVGFCYLQKKGLSVIVESLPVEVLVLDPRNARKHDEKNLSAIAGSLDRFGQRKPIVVTSENVVVAGNGTLTAAVSLGWEKIDVVRVPDDWSDDQVKAFALADNRTAELAVWDEQVMASQLLELDAAGFDVAEFGFEAVEPAYDSESIEEDEVPELPSEAKSKLGDIYKLGNHRLMCGDSTDISTVEKLMDGTVANLVFTDPPYGVEYQSNMRTKSEKFDVLKNDDQFLDIAPVIKKFSQGWVFVWTSWKVQTKWIDLFEDFGYPTNIVIWHKPGGGIGDLKKTFSSDYETALVWHRGAELCGKRIGSVWTINKDGASTYLHPTQKPIELACEAMDKTTNRFDNVLDLFGGSGSTLIAAEKLSRKSFLMELDPRYVDVIIQRWENLTGGKAELVS
jgi:DNA modification methylase